VIAVFLILRHPEETPVFALSIYTPTNPPSFFYPSYPGAPAAAPERFWFIMPFMKSVAS
jgi:hypothetical protein